MKRKDVNHMTALPQLIDEGTVLEKHHPHRRRCWGYRVEEADQGQLRTAAPRCVVEDDHPQWWTVGHQLTPEQLGPSSRGDEGERCG